MQSLHKPTYLEFIAKTDAKLQGMADCITLATQMNVTNANQIPGRLQDVGIQMNALKREKSRHENSIKKHEQIFEAFITYNRIRPLVEDVKEAKPEDVSAYKDAYAILSRNQVFTSEAYNDLRRRYEFEKRKISDYEKKMPDLNRQYRKLKKLEALMQNPLSFADEVYSYSLEAERKHQELEERASTIDGILDDATQRASGTDHEHEEEEYIL